MFNSGPVVSTCPPLRVQAVLCSCRSLLGWRGENVYAIYKIKRYTCIFGPGCIITYYKNGVNIRTSWLHKPIQEYTTPGNNYIIIIIRPFIMYTGV